ncbi:hypothetical protein GZH82_12340 [Staphylococcus ursi]|uniref:hypothetical protein n=1 Tax=Staphylococcus sp. MI 10-1553 TaxID=1912064 RepID=UPI0013983BA1|nr:hypothetical protein [Staphylococcus sp. MI 10-1553]QHW38070.1 hypothetical protein GZH82_12340 [Staphylococcus sp. MI 10-1553]
MVKISFTDLNINGHVFMGDLSFEVYDNTYLLSFRKIKNLDLLKRLIENKTEISIFKAEMRYKVPEPIKYNLIKDFFDGQNVRLLELEKDNQGYYIEVVKSDFNPHENFKRT